jgi:hypothetical protein
MANVRKCRRCNTIIASGRDYCDAHYLEALQNYNEDMERYERNMDSWNSKSSNVKDYLNRAAEDETRRDISGNIGCLAGAFLGGFIFISGAKFMEYNLHNLEWKGILIGIGSIFLFGMILGGILRNFPLIGRIIRCLFIGTIYYLLIGGLIGYMVFDDKITNHTTFLIVTGLISYLNALRQELSGSFFSTAAPRSPSKPRP